MGLQYKNEHGDCPVTLNVPNDGSVRGWLVTKCVVENHDGTNMQGVSVTHDTVVLSSIYLAADNTDEYAEVNSAVPFGALGDEYTERQITFGAGAFAAAIPRTRDIRQAAGVWLAPGDSFTVAGTNCRASVTFLEEI